MKATSSIHETLGVPKALLFGLLSACRLRPYYEQSELLSNSENDQLVSETTGYIIRWIKGDMQEDMLQDCRDRLDAVIPDSETYDDPMTSVGASYFSALAYLVDYALTSDPSNVEWALTVCTDALDLLIQARGQFKIWDPDLESKISSHPLMVKEKKTRDLQQAEIQSLYVGSDSQVEQYLHEAMKVSLTTNTSD